jgi:hypothetical protein
MERLLPMSGRANDPDLSNERRDALIEALAQRIEAGGLTAPAILLLEAHKPLSFLGSQALLVVQPILSFAFGTSTSAQYAALLEERSNVERLIQRLERQEHDSARPST